MKRALVERERPAVIRIALPYLYRLATELEPLASLPMTEVKFSDVGTRLFAARNVLRELHGPQSLYGPYLRSSRPYAEALVRAISRHTDAADDIHAPIESYGLHDAAQAFETYKVTLLAELGALAAYFVTQKGSHDTFSLLDFGETA